MLEIEMIDKLSNVFFDVLGIEHFLWYHKRNVGLLDAVDFFKHLIKCEHVWYQAYEPVVIHARHVY